MSWPVDLISAPLYFYSSLLTVKTSLDHVSISESLFLLINKEKIKINQIFYLIKRLILGYTKNMESTWGTRLYSMNFSLEMLIVWQIYTNNK